MAERSATGRSEVDREQLEKAIAAQEVLRGSVADDIVDAAIAVLQQQLAALSDDARRRGQVTVLFADVSGFTTMSEQLDPETVAERMNELWAGLDAVIAEHGGRVDKHIGDAVMAVWGTSGAQEDDVERAVRAGLRLHDEVNRTAASATLSLRVGINTGLAYLGAVGTGGEYTAMGDVVNVASRAQNFAPVGSVLITHDTYRHVRGIFDVEELDPATLKGKAGPVRVYIVWRAKPRAFRMATRGVEGVETRMIGREAELDTLRATFEQGVQEPGAQLVAILGEAGIGKSRLVYEFQNAVELHLAPAYLFKGRAFQTRTSVPFGLVRDVIGDRVGVLDSDRPAVVCDKLHAAFGPTLTADESELVGHWLGYDLSSSAAVQRLLGSGQLAATARAHFLRYLRTLGANEPVVFLLEDLHWADDDSLTLAADLVTQLAEAHVLVVGVARPGLLERAPGSEFIRAATSQLRLEPLDPTATLSLIEEVLQKAEQVPVELSALIAERSHGNPFYVEELVRMLIDDGVIDIGERWDAWRIDPTRVDPERVPATLTGVLQARLVSLSLRDRQVVQHASVVGRVFWDGAVAVLGSQPVSAINPSLDAARERELVFRHSRSSFDDCEEYAFQHALLREVTYETVLLRDRQRLHQSVAAWLTAHAGERLIEFAGFIASHHRLAGDAAEAANLLYLGARAAVDAGNSAGGRRNLEEALALWRAKDMMPPVGALNAMAEACLRLGDIDGSEEHVRKAVERAAEPEERAIARFLGSWAAAERGEREREQALLDAALPDAERVGGFVLLRVLTGLGWAALERGDDTAAVGFADRLEAVGAGGEHRSVARGVFGLLAAIAGLHDDLEGSLRHSEAALAAADATGDLEGQALAHSNVGIAHHLLGDQSGSRGEYLTALHHYERAIELARVTGQRLHEGINSANLAQVQTRLGDEANARRLIWEALTTLRAAGSVANLMFVLAAEGDRRLTFGDTSGLQLLGLVKAHPAAASYHESEIATILGRAGLPADLVEHGLAAGRDLDFEAVVDRLIHELAD